MNSLKHPVFLLYNFLRFYYQNTVICQLNDYYNNSILIAGQFRADIIFVRKIYFPETKNREIEEIVREFRIRSRTMTRTLTMSNWRKEDGHIPELDWLLEVRDAMACRYSRLPATANKHVTTANSRLPRQICRKIHSLA